MHPNSYLRSFWRSEVKDTVFVAMSFDSRFTARFSDIIKPAIEAYRVDNSRNGDSILTDICDGIAHSRLILADVSVIDEGRYTDTPIRNGNVMYEVGIALASRQPSEVLLIRDDDKKFLFDISTIPHIRLNFGDKLEAVRQLRLALCDRVRESRLLQDARLRIAAQSLTANELRILKELSCLAPNEAKDFSNQFDQVPILIDAGLTRLLQKGCIRAIALRSKNGAILFAITPFGHGLLETVEHFMPQLGYEHAINPTGE